MATCTSTCTHHTRHLRGWFTIHHGCVTSGTANIDIATYLIVVIIAVAQGRQFGLVQQQPSKFPYKTVLLTLTTTTTPSR